MFLKRKTDMKELTNKWPAILITGEKVTEEQAMDILIRTDENIVSPGGYTWSNNKEFQRNWCEMINFDEDCKRPENFVELYYLGNNSIASSWVGGSQSWIWEDGSIFKFSNIGKWPAVENVIDELNRITHAFPYLKLKVTLFDEEVMSDFYINGQKIADANYEDVLDKALCSFSVENGTVTYHDEPFKDHFSRDLIPASFNKENEFISECYLSLQFLDKLRKEVQKRIH